MEWERKADALEREGADLHGSRMKLMLEQVSTLSHHVADLQQDVTELKRWQSSIMKAKVTADCDAGRLDAFDRRLFGLEQHGVSIGELQQSQAMLRHEAGMLEVRQGAVLERLSSLEEFVGSSSESCTAQDAMQLATSDGAALDQGSGSGRCRGDAPLEQRPWQRSQSLAECLAVVAQTLAGTLRKQEKDLSCLDAKLNKLHLKCGEGLDIERVLAIEETLVERFEQQSQQVSDLTVAQARHEAQHANKLHDLRGLLDQRLAQIEYSIGCEFGASPTEEFRISYLSSSLAEQGAWLGLDAKGISLIDRIASLQSQCQEFLTKHERDLHALKEATGKHESQHLYHVKELDTVWKAVALAAQRHGQDIQELRFACEAAKETAFEEAAKESVFAEAHVGKLYGRLGVCELGLCELQDLVSDKVASDERMGRLERLVSGVIGAHASELGAAHVAFAVAERLVKLDDMPFRSRDGALPTVCGHAASRCGQPPFASKMLLEQERQHSLARIADRIWEESMSERLREVPDRARRCRSEPRLDGKPMPLRVPHA